MTDFSMTTNLLINETAFYILIGLFGFFCICTLLDRSRRSILRTFIGACFLALILSPSLLKTEGETLKNIALIVIDRSPSQFLKDRQAVTEQIHQELKGQLSKFENIDLRVAFSKAPTLTETEKDKTLDTLGLTSAYQIKETRLFQTIDQALATVPRNRLAGIILISDGQIHDAPDTLSLESYGAPIHTLLTGSKEEKDRRLVLVNAPTYGIVGKKVTLSLKIEDLPTAQSDVATLHMRDNEGQERILKIPVGRVYNLDLDITHGGQNVFEFEVAAFPDEITLSNNKAAFIVNGVRDRLKVLLVSGSPHAGERTWRNLLKADPSVDLVHFTILRPANKQDTTPINEMSLIAFPIRELFEIKLNDFDLIIFDRYKRQGVLADIYINNIAEYVRKGGAFLEASGPNFASPFSMYSTPLGSILPGQPTGEIFKAPFRPEITDAGQRHPVTSMLGTQYFDSEGIPHWGRWFRQIELLERDGETLLSGHNEKPLLLLNRVGEGRVAQLASDHAWLWSRGYEGGGPQAELLRRIAHWLMKEPDLEENNLEAEIIGTDILVKRRYLEEYSQELTLISPSGETTTLTLTDHPTVAGLATAKITPEAPGIYRFTNDDLSTVAVIGAINPPELQDVRATANIMAPLAKTAESGVLWLEDLGNTAPRLNLTTRNTNFYGSNWLALKDQQVFRASSISRMPLIPDFIGLIFLAGLVLFIWWIESSLQRTQKL